MPRTTMATLMADNARLRAQLASAGEPSTASSHWSAHDITCTITGCVNVFRTIKGRDWHVANIKHAKA